VWHWVREVADSTAVPFCYLGRFEFKSEP
jgi:hypothetical protein